MKTLETMTEANRGMQKWTARERAGRVLWALARPLFWFSPRPLWAWRRGLLRLFGADIGRGVHIYPTVRITIPWNLSIGNQAAVGDRAILYALGPIRIGSGATISQGAHLCAGSHDFRDPSMPLTKPPISIGAGAWICTEAFIGPGVTVGDHAIAGARAVVTKSIAAGDIVAGNPAQKIGQR
jgi:putative colanic acid biosynthesis acetyltransferase WcaF